MVFSSSVFLFIFLPLTLIGYYLIDRKFKNIFLLLASLIFYAWGEPKFVLVMIMSIAANYLFGLLIMFFHEKKALAKLVLAAAVAVNIALLWFFKYFGFTVDIINSISGNNIKAVNIALPIGISFFTFQAISYVIDVYRGNGEAQKNPLNVGLYIAFFPQLIAGPIVRYKTIAEQIKYRKENWNDFSCGIERFVIGFAKKVLLSNSLAIIADRTFNNIADSNTSVLMAWTGSIAYTFQIFYDFSGYSDMAIGLGKMFGFQFDENFNYPYYACSVSDFWRRWHISLSSWFRDYIYIPLGGSRVSKKRLVLNLFVVWTLTGIWHGASWNFIIWGWYYFILLVLEKNTGIPGRFTNKISKALYRVITFMLVNFGWVLFRADTLGTARLYISKMLGLYNQLTDIKSEYILWDNRYIFMAGIFFAFPIVKWFENKFITAKNKFYYDFIKLTGLIIILIIGICSVASSSYNPFIYFNF